MHSKKMRHARLRRPRDSKHINHSLMIYTRLSLSLSIKAHCLAYVYMELSRIRVYCRTVRDNTRDRASVLLRRTQAGGSHITHSHGSPEATSIDVERTYDEFPLRKREKERQRERGAARNLTAAIYYWS